MNLPTQRALAALALLQTGASLATIRSEVPAYAGRSGPSLRETLRRVAERYGMPEPVFEREAKKAKDSVTEPKPHPDAKHFRKRDAWNLRVQGLSWAEVAKELGIEPDQKGRDLVLKWAKRWGQRKGLDRSILENRDKLCWGKKYHADHKAGMGWKAIKRKWGRHGIAAIKGSATLYGEAVGDPVDPNETNDPQEVYEWVVETGATKEEAAEHWGYSGARRAGDTVRYWCQKNGIESPWGYADRGKLTPGRAEEAYNLRAAGVSWREVAERLDYSCYSSAHSCARKWARRHGRDWPAVLPSTPEEN